MKDYITYKGNVLLPIIVPDDGDINMNTDNMEIRYIDDCTLPAGTTVLALLDDGHNSMVCVCPRTGLKYLARYK